MCSSRSIIVRGTSAPTRLRSRSLEALEPIRQGVTRHFGGVDADTALGLVLRHDHGSNYMSQDFQNEIGFMGIASSPAFVRQPEGNGVAERAIRTLKEQLLWVRHFANVEELRLALANSPPFTTPPGSGNATGTRRPIRSEPNKKALKPTPPRSSNWRHNRRKALSHYRAPVHSKYWPCASWLNTAMIASCRRGRGISRTSKTGGRARRGDAFAAVIWMSPLGKVVLEYHSPTTLSLLQRKQDVATRERSDRVGSTCVLVRQLARSRPHPLAVEAGRLPREDCTPFQRLEIVVVVTGVVAGLCTLLIRQCNSVESGICNVQEMIHRRILCATTIAEAVA